MNLDKYRWENRIIVTFAKSENHPKLSDFKQQISDNSCGFQNRNLRHFHRIDYSVDDFKVVLIGKDGGIKMETSNISLKNIFQKIDAMPMRRYEMQYDSC